ncbi:MAG: hypothetical protein QF807_08165 [Candidatus Thalassarchaeaceae archaeon]|nr:hypothetical protein [Candidatus Thalassarchaeaceae archaeon]
MALPEKDGLDTTDSSSSDSYQELPLGSIDDSLYISDGDDLFEKIKKKFQQFGKKVSGDSVEKNEEQDKSITPQEISLPITEPEKNTQHGAEETSSDDVFLQDIHANELNVVKADDLGPIKVDSDEMMSNYEEEGAGGLVAVNVDNEPITINNQHNPMMTVVLPQKNDYSVLLVVGAVGLLVVFTLIFAGVLYVWANNLATKEIEGTWYNPVQTFTFSSNGNLEDNATTFIEWRTEGDTLYMVDSTEPGYEYYFRYSISDDVFFLAPLDFDGEVMGENCTAYTKDIAGKNTDDFQNLVVRVAWPDWCTPEE